MSPKGESGNKVYNTQICSNWQKVPRINFDLSEFPVDCHGFQKEYFVCSQ